MDSLNIAVVGSGISGLSAAWLLSQQHRVTLYEADGRLGGHSNTVQVRTAEGVVPVDTGFIVFNPPNYPNLTKLFEFLNVETAATEMSFAFSADRGAYEYSGSSANGYFGQRRNAMLPRHWSLLSDITRFFRTAQTCVQNYAPDISLGDFLKGERYCAAFIDDHIVPMGAAIWSTSANRMLDFPAQSFIDFYANHGMLQFEGRPQWRTVAGGSQNYVRQLISTGNFDCLSGCAVRKIVRHSGYIHIVDDRDVARPFDHVVIATHANQALELLGDADSLEQDLLGSFGYQENTAVLHFDPRWMPKRKRLWSSWNYLRTGEGAERRLCVTYWMNRLQDLDTKSNVFVTLNPVDEIHPKAVAAQFNYDHPVFCARALAAQKRLWALQGRRRTWFCGSYFGFGFHEDGLQSGLAVAEELGRVTRPWSVENPSGRIAALAVESLEAAE